MVGGHRVHDILFQLHGVGAVGGNGLVADQGLAVHLETETRDGAARGVDHGDIGIKLQRALVLARIAISHIGLVGYTDGLADIEHLGVVLADEDQHAQVVDIGNVQVADALRHDVGILLGEGGTGTVVADGVAPLPSEQVAQDMLVAVLAADHVFGIIGRGSCLHGEDIILNQGHIEQIEVAGGVARIVYLHFDHHQASDGVQVHGSCHIDRGRHLQDFLSKGKGLTRIHLNADAGESMAVHGSRGVARHIGHRGQGIAPLGGVLGGEHTLMDIDGESLTGIGFKGLIGSLVAQRAVLAADTCKLFNQHLTILMLSRYECLSQQGCGHCEQTRQNHNFFHATNTIL